MKLVLIATALLFYTQATETKECYAVTETKQNFEKSNDACKKLNGKVASEDLLDSENAGKAIKAIAALSAGLDSGPPDSIWLGISARNMDQELSEADNPFSFSDGTKVDDSDFNMLLKWQCKRPQYLEPSYKCAYIYSNGKLSHYECSLEAFALCTVACEDASSGSELSRANSSVFALFAAASVLKAFYALVGF